MRVLVVTESFLPSVNGVTGSVLRVLEHLRRQDHTALVVAPEGGPEEHEGTRVVRVPSVSLPGVSALPVGLPTRRLQERTARFQPDVVHLASPLMLGAGGLAAARRLGVPTVAVYQTDLAKFVRSYGAGMTARTAWRWLCRLHKQADRTLAPSAAAADALVASGVERVYRWGRGVDAAQFAPARRDTALRRRLAPGGELLVGYVGRLAPEKHVERLAVLAGLEGVRLVVVGDGPARPRLERLRRRHAAAGAEGRLRPCGSSSSPTSTAPAPGACAPPCTTSARGTSPAATPSSSSSPGPRRETALLPSGVQRITLPVPRIPGTGGYRLLDPHRVERLPCRAGPGPHRGARPAHAARARPLDRSARRVQLDDQPRARRPAARAVRVPPGAGAAGRGPAQRAAGRRVRRRGVRDGVRPGRVRPDRRERAARAVRRRPRHLHPRPPGPRLRRELADGAGVLLVHCGRLSREKHPQRSIDTVAALHAAGMRVRLAIAGDGPMRRTLERGARHLPVTFLRFLGHRRDVARLLASADVALAPGPHETFGLAALEALACGTPVVASRSSALAEIVEPGCARAVTDDPASFARAVRHLSHGDPLHRRRAARARAEQFDWPSAVDRMAAALPRA